MCVHLLTADIHVLQKTYITVIHRDTQRKLMIYRDTEINKDSKKYTKSFKKVM